MFWRDPNALALALFGGLVVGAVGVAAYGQPVEGEVRNLMDGRVGATSAETLEDLALDLKTRERLLDRRENLSAAGLQTAEERIRSRLTQLQQLREEVGGRISELQALRDETAKMLAELNARRASEQRDLREMREAAQADIEGKRKAQASDLELRRRQLMSELKLHRKDALEQVEAKKKELLDVATERNDDEVTGLVQMVEAMRPAEAGAVLVETNESLAVKVLERMARAKAGKAMATMDPRKAAALAEQMADPPNFKKLGVSEIGQEFDPGAASRPASAPTSGNAAPNAPAPPTGGNGPRSSQ